MKQLLFLLLISNLSHSQNFVIKGLVDPQFVNAEKKIYYNFDSKKLTSKKYITIIDSVYNGSGYYAYKFSIPFIKGKILYFNDVLKNSKLECLHQIDLKQVKLLFNKENSKVINSDIIVDNECQIRMYNISPENEKIAEKYTGTYHYKENNVIKEISLNQMFDSSFSSSLSDSNFMNAAKGKWNYIKDKNVIKVVLLYTINREIGIKKMSFSNEIIEINIQQKDGKEEFSINDIPVIKK